jgi:pimeloyl-ACP methyl ester carboxylesterase
MSANPEIGRSISAAGINTNYLEAGCGAPLILLHGSGPGVTAFANWHALIPTLAAQFHVYAPDLPGFGYTDCPAAVEQFTLEVWVSHLTAWMNALGLARARIIGNSFGGALALALAARDPGRVEKLVLMGSAGLEFPITAGLEAVWGYEPSPLNMRKLMETFAYNPGLVTEAIVQSRFEASIRPGAQENFARLFPPPRQDRLSGLATPEQAIRAIGHPALIIHGREDSIVPVELAYRFSSLLKNSELHVFGECGHWTQIERKERFLEIVIPFLTR